MRSRVTRYAILVLLAVVLGLGLLAYQSYRYYSGKSNKRPNFDIGALWHSDSPEALESIEDSELVFEVIPQRIRLDEVVNPRRLKQANRINSRMFTKAAVLVNPDEVARQYLDLETFEARRKEVDQLKIPLFDPNALSMRYQRRLEHNYLISPNLKPKKAKWFIEFGFAPSISFRTLHYREHMSGVAIANNTRYTYGMTQSFRDRTDRAISSFYCGVALGYNINDHWSISTGLNYAVYGESISVSGIVADDYNTEGAHFYNQTPLYNSPENEHKTTIINYNNRYSYFELPLQLAYVVLKNKKSELSLQAGVTFQKLDHVNALIYDFETDYYYWLPKNDLDVYNSYGVGSTLGVSLAQNISNTVEVFVNPQLKMNHSSSFDESYGMEQNHYALGLRLGVRKQLTKAYP